MTPPRKPRRAPPPPVARGAYGVVALADGAEFWCAWADAQGHASLLPDASGFARGIARTASSQTTEALLRMGAGLVFGVSVSPGAVDARLWLLNRGVTPDRAWQDDGAAVLAWRALGSPQAPAGAGSGPFAGPSPEPAREPPWFVGELGLAAWPCDRAAVKAAYHKRAMDTHPDRPGGSERAFRQTERAYREAYALANA